MFPVGERVRCNTVYVIAPGRLKIKAGAIYFVEERTEAGCFILSREWSYPRTPLDRHTVTGEELVKNFDWLAQLDVKDGAVVALRGPP